MPQPPPRLKKKTGDNPRISDKRPKASSAQALRRMRGTRRTGTGCELALQAQLRALRRRFRLDWPIPGTRRRIDIVFPRARVAVFVDGCFWHACPRHATWPKSNGKWWRGKIEANVQRDRNTDRHLKEDGWTVLRFWEHTNAIRAARKIDGVLKKQTVRTRIL